MIVTGIHGILGIMASAFLRSVQMFQKTTPQHAVQHTNTCTSVAGRIANNDHGMCYEHTAVLLGPRSA